MKFAFLSTMAGFPWGGSEELWYQTAIVALAEGHQVMVSVATEEIANYPKTLSLLANGAALAKLDSRNNGLSLRLARKLRNALWASSPNWTSLRSLRCFCEFKPDHVLISLASAACAATQTSFLDFAASQNVPYSIVLQYAPDVPDSICLRERQVVKSFFVNAVTAAFVSNRNRELVEEWIGTDLPNSVVVRNPLNLKSTEEIAWVHTDEPQFACVARLDSSVKGQDILIKVLASDWWKDKPWSLWFYGAGPHLEYLQSLCVRYGIKDRVNFMGQVSDIRSVWSRHQLLLMPSRGEGTPLALVEAMICGRPAVVTDVGGMTEWIMDGVNGFVADGANAADFGRALQRAWNCKEHWLEFGKSARKRALLQHEFNPGKAMLSLIMR